MICCVADHRRQREAAADGFAIAGQIGHDAVALLGPAPGDAKAGDDLVEDHDDAVLAGDLANRLQETRLRQQDALQRLHDHGGEVGGVPLDHVDGALRIVERRHQDRVAGLARHAHGIGRGARILGGAGGHRSPQSVVVHAMPRPLELEDLVALGERAGDAQGVERCFGAGAGVVHHFAARDRIDQALGEPDLRLVQKEVRGALGQLRR